MLGGMLGGSRAIYRVQMEPSPEATRGKVGGGMVGFQSRTVPSPS